MIEGLDATGHIVEINARMVSDFESCNNDDRDSRSAGHSDNGPIFSSAVVSGSDLGNADHSDNDWVFEGAARSDGNATTDHRHNEQIVSGAVHDSYPARQIASLFEYTSTAMECESVTFGVELSPFTFYDSDCSIYDSVCGTPESSKSYPEFICDPIPFVAVTEEEWDELNDETFGLQNILTEITINDHQSNLAQIDINDPQALFETLDSESDECLEPSPSPSIANDPEIDLLLIQRRIEATIHKRLAETTAKQTREQTISKILDAALSQKDRNDRRARDAAQGIEEDLHLWDEISLDDLFTAEAKYPGMYQDTSGNVSPRTGPQKKGAAVAKNTPFSGSQPMMHTYHGGLFAATEAHAYAMGLREIRPHMNYAGEWEGFMRAFSVDDANKMGLLGPVHMRGCCEQRPAEWHLYYGLMHAESEYEAERRHLTDIQRVPGCDNQFYGTIPADDEAHAVAMGISEIAHVWGCCLEGRVELPVPMQHAYSGVMSAVSRADVLDQGLRDPVAVPGECGDYYGGLFYGWVEARCEFEAWKMGLRKIEHAEFCCAEADGEEEEAEVQVDVDALLPDAQYTFYGYMYAHTEQELVDRGLKNALLVPGFSIKYSGILQAGSAEEAKAMGLFEPSRMEWSGAR
jgi:hypothetical protein